MAVSTAELRAAGDVDERGRHVRGVLAADNLSERSVMLEFRLDADPERHIVIPVDGITHVTER